MTPQTDLNVRFQDGFARFIDSTEVELQISTPGVNVDIAGFPGSLLNRARPLDLALSSRQSFRGRGPGRLSWSLTPASQMGLRVLFPGNAFLGNFRVGDDQFALQWDVDLRFDGRIGSRDLPFLARLTAGTRFHQTWIASFPLSTSLLQAIHDSFNQYVNLFAPEELATLADRQVVRWSWTGAAAFHVSTEWSLGSGWRVPASSSFGAFSSRLATGLFAEAGVEVESSGRIQLQAARRDDRLQVSVRRRSVRQSEAEVAVGARLSSSIRVSRLGPTEPALASFLSTEFGRPLIRQANRQLRRALTHRLEAQLAVAWENSRRRESLLRASWTGPDSRRTLQGEYGQLLSGHFPAARAGLKVSGSISRIRSRSFSVNVHLLDWLRLGHSRARQSSETIRFTPAGDLIVERGESLLKTRRGWDDVQFLRLLDREREHRGSSRRAFEWSLGEQGRFSRRELRQLLRLGLHAGILTEFGLPPRNVFPLELRLLISSHFSNAGLEAVRNAGDHQVYQALVRALQVVEARLYRPGAARRDWIDSAKLRQLIEENPAQAHLQSIYPIAGRSRAERIQIVATYRRVRRFLSWMQLWREGRTPDVLGAFRQGHNVPIFLLFHLLCPPDLRRSAALLTGDLQRQWGDPGLIASAQSLPERID